jgi:hypothetical protein
MSKAGIDNALMLDMYAMLGVILILKGRRIAIATK